MYDNKRLRLRFHMCMGFHKVSVEANMCIVFSKFATPSHKPMDYGRNHLRIGSACSTSPRGDDRTQVVLTGKCLTFMFMTSALLGHFDVNHVFCIDCFSCIQQVK